MAENENDDEIVTVQLPRWKVKVLDKMAEERQAYSVITSKAKSWWIWTVVAGLLAFYTLWDKVLKVGPNG